MFNSISLLSPFSLLPFFDFLLSFLLLGQASRRYVPSITSSLESEDSEGECRSFLLCFLFFLSFSTPFPRLLLLWRSPLHLYLLLVVSPQFPHPFFNLLCVISQNLPRNQRGRRMRFRLRRLILVYSFSFSLSFFLLLPPFFFLN